MTTVRCGNKDCTHNVKGVCRADSIDLTMNSKDSPYNLDCETAQVRTASTQACPPFWKVLLWGYPEVGIPAFRLLKNRADEEESEALTLKEEK